MSILKYENTLTVLSPDILFPNGLERAFTYENPELHRKYGLYLHRSTRRLHNHDFLL